jgi:hypothetical protein
LKEFSKGFSKAILKLEFLKWNKVLTGLEILWIWCQLSGPTSNLENFEINIENGFEKGLTSIFEIQDF